jgi:hypothetical protein
MLWKPLIQSLKEKNYFLSKDEIVPPEETLPYSGPPRRGVDLSVPISKRSKKRAMIFSFYFSPSVIIL